MVLQSYLYELRPFLGRGIEDISIELHGGRHSVVVRGRKTNRSQRNAGENRWAEILRSLAIDDGAITGECFVVLECALLME